MIHEFAALCLSLMATEFTSKVAINEASGVEHLIRLLGANDPDVQKNSIEAIAQLVMVRGSGLFTENLFLSGLLTHHVSSLNTSSN